MSPEPNPEDDERCGHPRCEHAACDGKGCSGCDGGLLPWCWAGCHIALHAERTAS